jgi:uncharacterized membrane protein YhaH (DUF805 family)
MISNRHKYWVFFLTWLIATPIACAASVGVSALWDHFAGDSSPGEGHTLPLIIAVISTVAFISAAALSRKAPPV